MRTEVENACAHASNAAAVCAMLKVTTELIYVFACGVFNDAFSVAQTIASNARMIMNNELQSWPYFWYYPGI